MAKPAGAGSRAPGSAAAGEYELEITPIVPGNHVRQTTPRVMIGFVDRSVQY